MDETDKSGIIKVVFSLMKPNGASQSLGNGQWKTQTAVYFAFTCFGYSVDFGAAFVKSTG